MEFDDLNDLDDIDEFSNDQASYLTDYQDHAILMHREAHYGGSFDEMIQYYLRGGKGACQEFEIERIQALADMEKNRKCNLAAELLTGAEMEKIARVKKMYNRFRDLYESSQPGSKIPLLIADLILSEEWEPVNEIEAVVKEKDKIVPALIELLRGADFYDPLFPGYGLSPSLAAACLGKIGDKRAIIALFELIGEENFFNEDTILDALHSIGEPAKIFLLKVLVSKPFTQDNEKAAIALINFKDDPEVALASFNMLKDPHLIRLMPLAAYLVLVCEGLKQPSDREEFIAMSKADSTPKGLKQDMKIITHAWK